MEEDAFDDTTLLCTACECEQARIGIIIVLL